MEIYMDMLKAVAEGKKKPTHIMYRANLPWTRFRKHMSSLLKQGLMKRTFADGSETFSLTPTGKHVLEYFVKIKAELYPEKKAPAQKAYASTK
jgi:predicted transcriptional regulator